MIKVTILVYNSLEHYLLGNPAGLGWEDYLGGGGGKEDSLK